jgi:hypothetical protein
MKDRDHPFFRPLYRRVLVTLFCAAWTAFELYSGEQLWSYIWMGLTAYSAWVFLYTYDRDREKPAPESPAADESGGPDAGKEKD